MQFRVWLLSSARDIPSSIRYHYALRIYTASPMMKLCFVVRRSSFAVRWSSWDCCLGWLLARCTGACIHNAYSRRHLYRVPVDFCLIPSNFCPSVLVPSALSRKGFPRSTLEQDFSVQQHACADLIPSSSWCRLTIHRSQESRMCWRRFVRPGNGPRSSSTYFTEA